MDSDVERERLKAYEKEFKFNKRDSDVLQFKNSQICKYECKNRASSDYRDEMIKQVQVDRRRGGI